MKKLLVLVGIQGAGKTTVLNKFKGGTVLKPSTMRKPRFPGEDEYHFESSWSAPDFAWTITHSTVNYGMRWSELRGIENVGLTVFDPASLATLRASLASSEFEIVTIGLNTITDMQQQHSRVNNDPKRIITQTNFDAQKNAVANCDIVLSGDQNIIIAAVESIASLLGGRGGVLSVESIKPLIAAGSLLEDADTNNIEPASYDLRIADKYWCQGKFHNLSDDNPVLTIPPYSFALVQAREKAKLPRFVVASFDIRVSLFFSGVVLSNGPQVDPGYSGDLFCMLHNASGSDVGINRDDHFASIQFQTLAVNSIGYNSEYQNKNGFNHFLDGSDSKKPGGQIYEYVTSSATKLDADFKNLKRDIIGITIGIVGVLATVGIWLIDKAADKGTAAVEAAASDGLSKINMIHKQAEELLARSKAPPKQ